MSSTPVVTVFGASQTFLVEAVVRFQNQERRAVASGQDIYAVSAPIVVESAHRILANPDRGTGTVSAGQIGDARTFLQSLSPNHLQFEV
jgi:hypothetical protein